jgi:sugar O-acyltransferase (sialic acid O-acetyltransferase NeuD family)
MAKKILIFGTGGNCIDILDTINEINEAKQQKIYECVGFLDDDSKKWGKEFYGVKVLGPLASADEYDDCFFINGIGSASNFWRKSEIIAKTGINLERFETIIHPTATVSKMATLGYGTVVFQQVTITSSVIIGHHIVILPNSVISHNDVIGDYTCIAGGVCISGNVRIGQSCYLGTNCAIISEVELGDYSLVGVGGVVLHNVPENSVMVGNPAKFLRKTREI